MTLSPAFHPKDNKILVSGSDSDGSTNLYLFDLEKNSHRKLTNNKGINISASFNPDGTKIVYTSDKSGGKKLYIMNIDDTEEYLLTRGQGSYDKATWSPDGKTIAFIKMGKGVFNVGLIDADGENERHLLKSFLIEGLKWGSNSRFLFYTKQAAAFGDRSIPKIYILDVKTLKEKQLPSPPSEGASDVDIILN
jgi:TolB protein